VNGEIPQASIAMRFAMAGFLLNTSRPARECGNCVGGRDVDMVT